MDVGRTSNFRKTGPGEMISPLHSNASAPKLLRGGEATFGSTTWNRGLADRWKKEPKWTGGGERRE